jgi:hypothetical protein
MFLSFKVIVFGFEYKYYTLITNEAIPIGHPGGNIFKTMIDNNEHLVRRRSCILLFASSDMAYLIRRGKVNEEIAAF